MQQRVGLSVSPVTALSQAARKLYGASGSSLAVVGATAADIIISGYACSVDFVVIDGLQHNMIFGISMLQENNAVIDIAGSTLSLANNLFTVPLIQRFQSQNILRTVHSITLEPYHEARMPVRLSTKYKLAPSLIEPIIAKHNALVAVAKAYVEPHTRTTVCQLVNFTDKPFTIPARMAIACITPATLLTDLQSNPVPATDTAYVAAVDGDAVSSTEKKRVLQASGFQLTKGDLTDQQFGELIDLLYEYRQVFVTDIKDLPGVKDVEYNITLQPGARPKRQRQFRYPPHMRDIIREQLNDWEQAGIISEGDPVWIHPIVLVKKKPIDAKPNDPPKYRVCLDLRAINKVMVLETYPMPTLTFIVDSINQSINQSIHL